MSVLSIERNRTIPWFVLSAGGGEVGRLDWVKKHRLEWDDWEKDFYSKTVDRVALYTRIPEIAVHSNATQIKTILYKDVFEALNGFRGIDVVSAKNILVKILIALHFDSNNFDPILHYNQLRQLVEHLFRACNIVGLVPDQCVPKGIVNLSDSLNYLCGKKAGKAGVRFGQENDRIVTHLVEKEIRSVLGLGNTNSHTVKLDASDQKLIEELFRTANSKYVIFSLALQMCDVIVWLKDYISIHDNKEQNLSKCVVLPEDDNESNSEITLEEAKSKYEGKEFLPIKEQDGVWHCGDCLVKLNDTHSGPIKIVQVVENTDKKLKSRFRFYAQFTKV